MRATKEMFMTCGCTCSFKSTGHGWLGLCASSLRRWPRVAHQPKKPSSLWQHFPLCFFSSCVVCWWHKVWAPFQRTTLSPRCLGRENCFAVTSRRCFLRTKSVKLFPSRPSFLRRRTPTGFASGDSRVGRARIRKILALTEWELSSLTGLARYWMPNR